MKYRALSRAGAPMLPHTAIFPIMKDHGSGIARLVGTGFFLTQLGHFVTAKHVIDDAFQDGEQIATLHAVHFVEDAKVLVRHITKVSFDSKYDIAVGKMDYHVHNESGRPLLNRVPVFSHQHPKQDSRVVTYAYPESDAEYSHTQVSTFRPSFYEGHFRRHSEVPRDSRVVAWPYYETSIDLLGGSSGGPVFDERGRVIGINCVGGIAGVSYHGRVRDMLDLTVPEFPRSDASTGDPTVRELAALGLIRLEPPL